MYQYGLYNPIPSLPTQPHLHGIDNILRLANIVRNIKTLLQRLYNLINVIQLHVFNNFQKPVA